MADFQVNPGDLGTAAAGMSRLLSDLRNVFSEVRNGNAGAAGAAELESALGRFLTMWSSGLEELHTSLSELQNRLAAAGEEYSTVDANVSRALGG